MLRSPNKSHLASQCVARSVVGCRPHTLHTIYSDQKASASVLPFEDEFFDAAVSNFVFHAVGDVKDTRDVVKKALRVVKKGGSFVFQDQFLDEALYGQVNDLIETIKSWGIEIVL